MDLQQPADQPGSAPGAQAQAAWKLDAARAAVAMVPPGCVLGLGSGTTAELMLRALAERMGAGMRVVGVPTSERTRGLAAALDIPLAELNDVTTLDMSIDGADEVLLPALDLVKGRGGALLREKLVAAASKYRVIIVDATKLVPVLGSRHPVPVEVEQFGWRHAAGWLRAMGGHPVRRIAAGAAPGDVDAAPFITDGGHYLLDCAFGPIAQPAPLAAQIKAIPGVVDHGLFVGMTERICVAGAHGTQIYDRPR